jgi:type II secretory pathway pseudopilin PulG
VNADRATVLRRLRTHEEGFGLLELIISMLILNIGLLALVAAFNSGSIALKRASEVSTATALADRQMELYRGIKYDVIGLQSGLVTTANADALYAANWPTGTPDTTSCTDATKNECKPVQTVTGPDGRSYRIDSYVVSVAASGTHNIKLVRVFVRSGAAPDTVLVRAESTFDASTGS